MDELEEKHEKNKTYLKSKSYAVAITTLVLTNIIEREEPSPPSCRLHRAYYALLQPPLSRPHPWPSYHDSTSHRRWPPRAAEELKITFLVSAWLDNYENGIKTEALYSFIVQGRWARGVACY